MEHSEDRQFECYRSTGSTKALAKVFDIVAPELFRVAWYLAQGDQHRAEDALQATFLTAIEDRSRWDATRRLRPWLLGILANHIRKDERRAVRSRGVPSVLDALPMEGKIDAAEAAEVRSVVHEAVRGLPQPYREAVILHLEHGLGAAEIAEALSRKPGTVRTQLVRGLELVRKVLPASIATGAILSLPGVVVASEIIKRVRDVVADHASHVGEFASTSPMGKTPWVHQTRLAVMIVSLLSALLVTWALWPEVGFTPLTPVAIGPSVVETPADTGSGSSTASRDEIDVGVSELVVARVVSYTIAVRVVDKDGAPRPDESVMLLLNSSVRYAQSDAKGMAEFDVAGGALHYQVGVVGRFVSTGATLMGPPLRREHELVIKPGLHLDVRVADLNGRPIAGAIVEGVLGEQWLRTYNLLGQTDVDGVLHLRDVESRGQIKAYAHGHQATPFKNFSGKVGDTVSLTLRSRGMGLVAKGRVVDAMGTPIVGAELAVVQFGHTYPVEQYFESGEDGYFELDWLHAGRHLITGIARGSTGALRGIIRFEHSGAGVRELELRLVKGQRVVGSVLDADGNAIALASVSARYVPDAVFDVPFVRVSTRSAPDGSFEIVGVLPGPNELRASGGSVELEELVDIPAVGEFEWQPRGVIKLPLEVQLVNDRDAPLEGWSVELRLLGKFGFQRGPTMMTDADGFAGRSNGRAEWQLEPSEVREIVVRAPVADGSEGHGNRTHDTFPTLISPPVGPSDVLHKIVVPRTARLDASVIGRFLTSDGSIVQRGKLLLASKPRKYSQSLSVDADEETGRFAIGPLSKGRYELIFQIDGKKALVRTIDISSGTALDLGDVRMPRVGTLHVTPTYADGTIPPRSDRVVVRVESSAGTHWTARRQKDGSYRARGVHRGALTLLVWGNHSAPKRVKLNLEAEQAHTTVELAKDAISMPVDVILPAGHERNQSGWSGTFTVRDPHTGALMLEVKREHSFKGLFESRLRFTLPLSAGQKRITVESWDDVRASVDVLVPAARPVEIVLPLRRD